MEENNKFKRMNIIVLILCLVALVIIGIVVYNIAMKQSKVLVNNSNNQENIAIENINKEQIASYSRDNISLNEDELKKYLSVFSFLYSKSNVFDIIETAREIQNIPNIDMNNELQRTTINNIIDSFYWENMEYENGVVKGIRDKNDYPANFDDVFVYSKDTDSYEFGPNVPGDMNVAHVINILDISYNNETYTIRYKYTVNTADFPTIDYIYYEKTIKLKYNPNSQYSKYKIVSLGEDKRIVSKLTKDELKVAEIGLGMTKDDVIKLYGNAYIETEKIVEEYDGNEHSEMIYKDLGLLIGLTYEDNKAVVRSVILTEKQIEAIRSLYVSYTKEDVLNVFNSENIKDLSSTEGKIVVGIEGFDPYGEHENGTIQFILKYNEVAKIILTYGAE